MQEHTLLPSQFCFVFPCRPFFRLADRRVRGRTPPPCLSLSGPRSQPRTTGGSGEPGRAFLITIVFAEVKTYTHTHNKTKRKKKVKKKNLSPPAPASGSQAGWGHLCRFPGAVGCSGPAQPWLAWWWWCAVARLSGTGQGWALPTHSGPSRGACGEPFRSRPVGLGAQV